MTDVMTITERCMVIMSFINIGSIFLNFLGIIYIVTCLSSPVPRVSDHYNCIRFLYEMQQNPNNLTIEDEKHFNEVCP